MEHAGADATKVGIGPGKVCITKIKTGFGTGGWQLAALRWCSKAASKPVIADGGIPTNSDIAKLIRFGASMIRGLYLCVSTSTFYDKSAFHYNEKTGEVTSNTNYEGANALFDLPLDIKKADHEKAEKYLQELLKPSTESTGSEAPPVDWEKEFADAVVIPESVKVVTIDEKGMAHYEYDGGKMDINLNYLFEGQPTVISKIASIQGTDDESIAIRFSRDANGTITAMALRKK